MMPQRKKKLEDVKARRDLAGVEGGGGVGIRFCDRIFRAWIMLLRAS
jgi:hypothetical protein